jgi:F0F1-type ATP synthase epsilon subunit
MATAPPRLNVKVFSPYQVFFEGTAESLTARNKTGPFDVLYNHGNFLSTLMPGRIAVNTGREIVNIEISSGIIRVSNNLAIVFANV